MIDFRTNKTIKQLGIIPCGLSCALIAGVALDWHLFHSEAAGSDAYHQHVREVAATLPFRAGDWVSEDTPVVPSAVAILHPNVIMERRYRNVLTGLEAQLLIVQCLDARDILGHYPPVCYVANGYTLEKSEPDVRSLDSLEVNGMSYAFSSARLATRGSIKVFDFMILPDGEIAPDMASVNEIARNRHQRYFGAGQIQIITDDGMADEDRNQVIKVLLNCASPVIDAIRSGTFK